MENIPPLTGLKVIEIGQVAAGPFAASLLADLGADVVKIESPDGDGMRQWPPFNSAQNGKYSENFASLNRNKRSIALDLKNASNIELVRRLSEKADVLLENFRPGVLKRLGLGYETLSQSNSKLIYCSISGYGQVGPYAQRGAFDVTIQAISGLMSVTGEEDGAPVKCGVPVGDFCAGLYAAYSILATVLRARDSGRGAYIDCSMLGSVIGISALQTSEYFGTGAAPKKLGSAHPRNAPYQAYKTKDSYLVIAAGNDRLWFEVCQCIGQPALVDDSRFKSQLDRARNQRALAELIQPELLRETTSHWLVEMDKRGIPCAPINTFPDVLEDVHAKAMGLVTEISLPNGGTTRTTRFPLGISDFEFSVTRPPPALGEHRDEVIKSWLG